MDNDQLFIRSLEDLENRLKSQDEYEILMIAGLLRKLLLDESPLIDQVNRRRRQKIKFTVNDYPVPSEEKNLMFWSVEDVFYPKTGSLFYKPIEVTKAQLLSRTVMIYDSHSISVRELIKHVAHIQGAVHSGMPKTNKEEAMKKLAEMFGIGGLPAGLRLLCVICRVIIEGLEPLKEQIMTGD